MIKLHLDWIWTKLLLDILWQLLWVIYHLNRVVSMNVILHLLLLFCPHWLQLKKRPKMVILVVVRKYNGGWAITLHRGREAANTACPHRGEADEEICGICAAAFL